MDSAVHSPSRLSPAQFLRETPDSCSQEGGPLDASPARSKRMHELSITQGIVESVCEAVPEGKVLAVTVEIGKLSGVVSDSVRFCFDLCAQGTPLEGARLDIVDVAGRGRCGCCHHEMEMKELVTWCPCGNPFLEILRGKELRVRSVEVT